MTPNKTDLRNRWKQAMRAFDPRLEPARQAIRESIKARAEKRAALETVGMWEPVATKKEDR